MEQQVSFEEEKSMQTVEAPKKGLTDLLIQWGIAKDAKGAEILMISAAVISVIVAIVVLLVSGGSGGNLNDEERARIYQSTLEGQTQ